jgi:SnoaL-like polyketide cyclase
MSEHNKALMRRFYDAWNMGKMDEVVSMIAPNYIDHAMPPEMANGREGFLKARALGKQALADVHLQLEHILLRTITLSHTLSFMQDRLEPINQSRQQENALQWRR